MPLHNDKLLVHSWAPAPPGWLERVSARFPGLDVRWEQTPMGKDDLVAADTLPAEVKDGVTMICVFPPPSPEMMKHVRFVQLASAGSDRWLQHPSYLNPDVQFCSASGCHATGRSFEPFPRKSVLTFPISCSPQIAEWVFGSWLSFTHHFQAYTEQQKAQDWRMRVDLPVKDGLGRRMGILGYGAIGRQCARLASAFGLEVYAFTNSPRPTPESRKHDGFTISGTGDPDGIIPAKWFSGGQLNEFLAQDLDILVISTPLTSSTRGLIGAEQFKIMSKSKTFVSNIGRGPIIDTASLVEALEKGLIGGAALDVQDPEPLPAGHPLWTAPNVFISPHMSWSSTSITPRLAELLYQNLERLDRGEPLLNLIKKT
ncbi:hypothetical protein S7711_00666 [Stachybotrys chartarum IBT 7711]|uniref:D-isomer specific 2-hydroxyacid dehydrogenase NAD-binding domain-containing protein n=1 Tax=Stachybotrys chartarum (strain CBS 109288 / IBT 7711) TaxID=1280523 RepID=A0A084AU19_STACB|nr:hypothetical protein S7711_00666 [Stachybotrys chartarum IBT 7711]KFA47851.1 hypothetical protein S40293_06439 [Stachybotrys chartarum IBT 40293]